MCLNNERYEKGQIWKRTTPERTNLNNDNPEQDKSEKTTLIKRRNQKNITLKEKIQSGKKSENDNSGKEHLKKDKYRQKQSKK